MALAQLQHTPARLEQERRVLGQRGRAEAWQPVLPRAQDLSLAADREVDLSEREAISLPRDGLETCRRGVGLRVAEEDAEGLVLAAAHPATELVELREPEALGSLDQHHG